jgi:hypothetical protein
VHNDRWGSRYNQNDVPNDGNSQRPANRLISTEVGIRNIGAKEWEEIDPELIESSDTSRSSLFEIQGTRLAIVASSCVGALRERLLDEVGDCTLLMNDLQGHSQR